MKLVLLLFFFPLEMFDRVHIEKVKMGRFALLVFLRTVDVRSTNLSRVSFVLSSPGHILYS